MSEENQKGRVIVTYSRSLIALMIAQSLGARGIEIIGCDDVGMTVLSFSKFVTKTCVYTAADEDEEQFIEDLLTIVRNNQPDDDRPYVLIPAFNDAKVIAKNKDRFKDLITIACPDFESIDQVDPKDHFAATAQKYDVSSPQTWMPKNEEEFEDALKEMEFPVFIKPPDDVGGRGISKQRNEADLRAEFQALKKRYPGDQILIQSTATGVDYCFCGLFDRGKLIASMVYHNNQKFPNEAGPGVVRETVDSKRFDGLAQELMEPLKWHGVVEIDFMWDEDENSTPIMIEVNPRFWAGLDHSVKSGMDFPWLLYRLFVDGHAEPQGQARTGYKTSLPGLTTMARIEELFTEALNFEELEEKWPQIKTHLKNRELSQAAALFKDAIKDSISIEQAIASFKTMTEEAKQAEKISYGEDDPFIGLGVLFILASLIRHGKLPPEITR